MTYSEKLKDPRWQKKRLEVLAIHNFTCTNCEATNKTLHVHHKRYIKGREPWQYSHDELDCLCVDCHTRTSEVEKIFKGAHPSEEVNSALSSFKSVFSEGQERGVSPNGIALAFDISTTAAGLVLLSDEMGMPPDHLFNYYNDALIAARRKLLKKIIAAKKCQKDS